MITMRSDKTRTDHREIAAGVCIILFGLFVFWKGFQYGLGSARQLGSGAIPMALGFASICIGAVLLRRARQSESIETRLALKPFLSTIIAMAVWGFLAPRYGMVPATVGLAAASALGQPTIRPLEIIALAVVLSAGGALVFLVGLGVPLRIVNW